jgi:hypothetical protein
MTNNDDELFTFLSDVVQMNFDPDPPYDQKESDIEFIMKDGRTIRRVMPVKEMIEIVRYLYQNKELSKKITVSSIGRANKDLE